jgi:hypothetical protein
MKIEISLFLLIFSLTVFATPGNIDEAFNKQTISSPVNLLVNADPTLLASGMRNPEAARRVQEEFLKLDLSHQFADAMKIELKKFGIEVGKIYFVPGKGSVELHDNYQVSRRLTDKDSLDQKFFDGAENVLEISLNLVQMGCAPRELFATDSEEKIQCYLGGVTFYVNNYNGTAGSNKFSWHHIGSVRPVGIIQRSIPESIEKISKDAHENKLI